MNLEDQAIAKASRRMAQAIDEDLMADMLVACGWTRIQYSMAMPREQAYQIKEWINTDCSGAVRFLNNHWLFEHAKDATMYILKWT